MIPLSIWYAHDQDGAFVASTSEEVDAALDRVAGLAETGGCVATVVPLGSERPVLYVGLNGDVGALCFTNADETWWSVGRADGGVLVYDWQQNVFEFPASGEIPAGEVRRAVREFAETGSRPLCVSWQEWERPSSPGGTDLADDDPAWG